MFNNPSEASFMARANEYGAMIERGEHRNCKGKSKDELEQRIIFIKENIRTREMESPGLKAYDWRCMLKIVEGYLNELC